MSFASYPWNFCLPQSHEDFLLCFSLFYSLSVFPSSADERFDATFHTNVLVNASGSCQYIPPGETHTHTPSHLTFLFIIVIPLTLSCPPGILKSTCYIDVRWFPFDVQKCDLKFGSWTHNGWLLDLQMLDVDISTYIPNGEWDLVGKTLHTHVCTCTQKNTTHTNTHSHTLSLFCLSGERGRETECFSHAFLHPKCHFPWVRQPMPVSDLIRFKRSFYTPLISNAHHSHSCETHCSHQSFPVYRSW